MKLRLNRRASPQIRTRSGREAGCLLAFSLQRQLVELLQSKVREVRESQH